MKKSLLKRFIPFFSPLRSDRRFPFFANCLKTIFSFTFFFLSIGVFAQVQVEVQGTDPACGGFSNGTATAIPSGGWEPYTFIWSTGETTQTITGLAPGTYTVTATDLDGGYNYGSITLSGANQTDADIIIDEPCSGNGNVTINATGGLPPYIYNWGDGYTGGSTRTGLETNTQYCVTVLDENLCGVITCTTIPLGLELDISATGMACADSDDGSLLAAISNGTPPYNVLWSNGVTTLMNENLSDGTYTVTVTDGSGCSIEGSGTVGAPAGISLNINSQFPTCSGDTNGFATVFASGGAPNYSYLWSNGSTAQSIGGLNGGIYSVTVTDSQGCNATTSVTIQSPIPLVVQLFDTNPTCSSTNGGTIMASVSNGNSNYSYAWSTGSNNQTISGLGEGTYSVTVTNSNGCEDSATVTLTQEGATIFAVISEQNATCGLNNGTMNAFGSNGSGNYSYSWSNGATTQMISNLSPGTYTVTITDNETGCTTAKTETITNTSSTFEAYTSDTNETCGQSNGTASAFTNGGDAPFTYLWNTGGTTQTITGLSEGSYTVTVTDANGCSDASQAWIDEVGADFEAYTSDTNETCGQSNGTASAFTNGGDAPFTYLWNTGGTTQTITGLSEGSYTVTVTDANGCSDASQAWIDEVGADFEAYTSDTNETCGQSNGTASAFTNGGDAPFTYLWNTGGTTQTITGLSEGSYTVTVTDANGCSDASQAWIDEVGADFEAYTSDTNETCGQSNGTASAFTNGGDTPFTYLWNTGGTTQTITGLSEGSYTVTVTDANGCSDASQAWIDEVGADFEAYTSDTNETCGQSNGTASAFTNGGDAPFTYLWNTGGTTQTITGLSEGSYTVTVTDANGCSDDSQAWLEDENSNISCSISITNPVGSNENEGELTVNVTNGSGNYSYLWNNGENDSVNENLSPGTYSVIVTENETGCTTECSVSLFAPSSPTGKIGNMVFHDINLDGDNDNVDGGIADVIVTLTGTTDSGVSVNMTTSTNASGLYLFEQLESGTYKVTFSNLPEDFSFSSQNTGINDERDSDVDINTGMTDFFYLANGECNLTIDAGAHPGCPCNNFTDGGTLCCNQTSCGSGYDPDPITSLSAPSGGSGGEIEYIWMYKEGIGTFDETSFIAIPNSNSPTYDPGPIYTTTSFYRCVRRGPCCPYIEANGVFIYINDDTNASFEGPINNILCIGETYTYTATTDSPSATFQWTVAGNPQTTDLTASSIEVVWSSIGVHDVELEVTDNACVSSTIDSRLVTNSTDYCSGGQGIMGLVIDATIIHSGLVELELIRDSQMEGDFEYTIERSKLGEEFEEIGSIDLSNGTYFKYEDNAPFKGHNYYRVKMENNFGIVSYSNIEQIKIFTGIENTFVYPNPFNNIINYEILDTYNDDVVLEIVSPDGRIVRSIVTDKETFQQSINLDELSTGIYFLKFYFSEVGVQTYKVLKQ